MKYRYAQEKGGQKLHIVFDHEDVVSQPLCGRKVSGYRMTINAPLAHACKNCVRSLNNDTRVRKMYNDFLDSLKV